MKKLLFGLISLCAILMTTNLYAQDEKPQSNAMKFYECYMEAVFNHDYEAVKIYRAQFEDSYYGATENVQKDIDKLLREWNHKNSKRLYDFDEHYEIMMKNYCDSRFTFERSMLIRTLDSLYEYALENNTSSFTDLYNNSYVRIMSMAQGDEALEWAMIDEVERYVAENAAKHELIAQMVSELTSSDDNVAEDNSKSEEPTEKPAFQGVMPTFQGGDLLKFREWVMSKVKYPKIAIDSGIQGNVVIKFVVDVKGKIKDIEVLQSPDQSLSDAVIEILHKANDLRRGWDPGKDEDGNAVNMEFTLPISFKLM